jgi:hypothetical protein
MTQILQQLRDDADLRASLTASGLETIKARHTCAHRADELLSIVDRLAPLPARAGLGGGSRPSGLDAREGAFSPASSRIESDPPLDPLPSREGKPVRLTA